MRYISFDPEADAAYIKLTDERIAHTEVVNDTLLIDRDYENGMVGIEILNAIAQMPLIQTLKQKYAKDLTIQHIASIPEIADILASAPKFVEL